MRVLVSGVLGNVGQHVARELVRRGYGVRGLDVRRGRVPGVEMVVGDVRDMAAVASAVAGVDVVVHLAAVIPPESDERPVAAREVNVGGTGNVIKACVGQERAPRLVFTSTFDVHGRTRDRVPPRRVEDPLVATDPYTEHKIECERLVRGSGLAWTILRLTDVPVLGVRKAHPIMFEIGLDNRIEALHAGDAAVAIANALETPGVWGRVLFVGGGASCQVTYGEYLTRLLGAMGVRPLPERAFSAAEYVTDWVDTAESEALLRYQRHSFDDIAGAIAASLGWRRWVVPLVEPLVRWGMLRLSPYYRAR